MNKTTPETDVKNMFLVFCDIAFGAPSNIPELSRFPLCRSTFYQSKFVIFGAFTLFMVDSIRVLLVGKSRDSLFPSYYLANSLSTYFGGKLYA